MLKTPNNKYSQQLYSSSMRATNQFEESRNFANADPYKDPSNLARNKDAVIAELESKVKFLSGEQALQSQIMNEAKQTSDKWKQKFYESQRDVTESRTQPLTLNELAIKPGDEYIYARTREQKDYFTEKFKARSRSTNRMGQSSGEKIEHPGFHEKEVEHLNELLKIKEREVAMLTENLDQMKIKVPQLIEENEKLVAQISFKTRDNNREKYLTREVEDLKDQIARRDEEVLRLNQSLSQHDTMRDRFMGLEKSQHKHQDLQLQYDTLKHDHQHLLNDLVHKANEITELRNELSNVGEMKNRLKRLEEEYRDYTHSANEWKKEADTIRVKNLELESCINSSVVMENESRVLKRENENLNAVMARKLQEVKDIKISLFDLSSENEKLVQENKTLKDAHEYLSGNQADWKREQEETKARVRELEVLVKEEAQKYQGLEFDIETLKKQLGKKSAEIEYWKSTASHLEQNLKEVESIKRKFSAIAEENEKLAVVIEHDELREKEAVRKIESLENELCEYKEIRVRLEQVKKEKEKVEYMLDQKMAEVNEMQLKLQELSKKAESFAKLKEDEARFGDERCEFSKKIEAKNSEIEQCKELIRGFEKKSANVQKMEDKYKGILAENDKLSGLISLRIRDNDSYKEKIKDLEHELKKIDMLQAEIESFKNASVRAEEILNRKAEDAESWRKKHVAADKRVVELELKIQGLQRDLSHQKAIVKDKTEQIDSLSSKVQTLETQTDKMDEIERTRTELERNNVRLEAQNESINQELHALEVKQRELLSRKQELEKSEQALLQTQRKLADANAELEKLQGKLQKSQEEIVALESSNFELTKEKNKVPILQSELQALENERNKALMKIKELDGQLEERSNELKETKEKIRMLSSLEGQLGAKQMEINRMIEILNESNKKEEDLKARVLGLEGGVAQQRGENEYLRRECDSLTSMILKKSHEVERLTALELTVQGKELESESLSKKAELLREENLRITLNLQEKGRLLEESEFKIKELDKSLRQASRDNERLNGLLKEKEDQELRSRGNFGDHLSTRGSESENIQPTLESHKVTTSAVVKKSGIGARERESIIKEANRQLEDSQRIRHLAKAPSEDSDARRTETNRNLSPIFEQFRAKLGDSGLEGKALRERRY